MEFIKPNSDNGEEVKLPEIFNYLIILLWLALIYAPFDEYATEGNLTIIQNIFDKYIIKFNVFQYLSLSFLFYLFYFKRDKTPPRYTALYFFFTIATIVIGLLNPGNDLTTGQYFYESAIFRFYYFLLFSFALFFIEKELYITIFNKIFTVGLYVLLFRSIHALLFYFSGRGLAFNGGLPSTIPQMDTLIYLSAFQIICLALFLNTRNKTYLIYILIFLATLFFSYRRSALGLGLIADIILLGYYLLVTPHKTKAIKMLVVFVGALIILGVSFQMAMPKKFDDVFNRMAGAFSFFSSSSNSPNEYTDSGHMEQSIETTQVFFDRIQDTFWGAGFGNPAYFIEGQAEDGAEFAGGIHNSFVLAWAQWGLHVTLFLVFLVFLMFRILLELFNLKTSNFVIPAIIIFLFGYLILGWSNGILVFEHLQYVMAFVMLFSVVKFLPDKSDSNL